MNVTQKQMSRNMWVVKVDGVEKFVTRYNPSVSAGTGFMNGFWDACKFEDYKMASSGTVNGKPNTQMMMTNSTCFKTWEKMVEWVKKG